MKKIVETFTICKLCKGSDPNCVICHGKGIRIKKRVTIIRDDR